MLLPRKGPSQFMNHLCFSTPSEENIKFLTGGKGPVKSFCLILGLGSFLRVRNTRIPAKEIAIRPNDTLNIATHLLRIDIPDEPFLLGLFFKFRQLSGIDSSDFLEFFIAYDLYKMGVIG